ncbi:helix-turn-helix domain-containing protein [Vibrio sp.]|nr:helix-turn-helix domain-containing protein [Vibrio sp.]
MQLNQTIAKQIVERVQKIISHSINVMDEHGYIIGSSDMNRLNQCHEGALLAIKENRTVSITKENQSQFKDVKLGINLPIFFQDRIVGVIGISGEPSQITQRAELVKMAAEMIIEQVELMAQMDWSKRHKEELVLQLTQSTDINKKHIPAIAQKLDIDLSKPRIASILKVIPHEPTMSISLEYLQRIVHLLENPERDNLVGISSVSLNEVIVLKPITLVEGSWSKETELKRVEELLERVGQEGNFRIKIALGDYFPDIDGLAISYETAKLTLNNAKHKKEDVFFYRDNRLEILANGLLDEPWKKEQIAQPYHRLIQNDPKGTSLKTLRVLFEQNLDFASTCNTLHIHRNTLRYRIEKIESETKLNIKNLNELLYLYLSVKLMAPE